MKNPWKSLFRTHTGNEYLEAMNVPHGVLVRSTKFVEDVGLTAMVFVPNGQVAQDGETQEYYLRRGDPTMSDNI